MAPLSADGSLDLSTARVVAVVAFAVLVTVLAVGIHRLVQAYGDELKVLWDEYGPLTMRRLLGRRRMPATPWFCLRCKSYNARGHARCYACGARREEAEAPIPNADAPSGQAGGRSRRTRR